jgi:hypothetical protein
MAMRAMGRDDEVIALGDDLSFGPIAAPSLRDRLQWLSGGFADVPAYEQIIERFWRRVAEIQGELVAWLSTKSVSEYCGFLELLHRTSDVPISVIDLAEVSTAFASVGPTRIVELGLIRRAVRLSDLDRQRYEAEWQRMREENAALRILTTSGLASVPITHYDDMILSFVTDEWTPGARIIGGVLELTTRGPFRQCGADVFLCDRLFHLATSGVIEGRCDHEFWTLRGSWFRHPQTPEAAS